MLKPKYELYYAGSSLDVSNLVDTRETVITRQLCTTSFKSAVDRASIVIRYSPDELHLRQNILDFLYGSMETLEDIALKITMDTYSLFMGYLDLSELKLSSKRLPESIKLEAKDVSAKLLDRKIDDYIFYEKKTISQIVTALIKHAGGTFLNNNIKAVDDRVLPVFTIDREDDDGTYREYIDTLLFEAGGYVLDTDENGKMSIVALPWESYTPTATVDDYLLEKGVETTRKIFDKNGLKLTWSTLSETGKNQRVWSADFSRNIQDGKAVGIDIPSGTYYPENGDIEPTYQSFSADFLDREYITHQRRDKNKDLSVIAVRDVTAQIIALDSNGKRLDNAKVWDFPILPSLGMVTNPTIYAKKAWYLLKNKYASTVNLQFFTLEGRVLYRSKVNHLTIPATAQKLEEYTSQYIFSDEHAKRFSQFYWHYLKYSSTIHKWSVLGDVSLGDVVKVLHKGASAAQASIIVSESLHFVGNTSKVDCVAVALGKYNEYPVKAWTDAENVAPPIPVPEAPKHLSVDVFPTTVSYYADNYPLDENTKIKVTVNAENIKEPINVSWNGGSMALPISGGVFEIPVNNLTNVDVLSVSATANGITSSASVSKSMRPGKVTLHSSKGLFNYYADNVPHDEKDVIQIEYVATGFKKEPIITLDGVAMQMNPDRTYTIPVSAIKNKDVLKVEAKIAGFYDSLEIQKIKDIPALNMTLSGTQFFYYADNVPHDTAAQIHVSIKTSGIFEKPALKIDGVVEPLSLDQTCIIPVRRMEGQLMLNLEATCFTLSRTAEISKIIDVPTVGLSLTTDHFTYYADNVVKEGQPDIVATATSTGLARGLKLTVNDIEFPLNDAGQAFISSTILDGNIESASVKVEPRHVVTLSDIRMIKKEYMTPSLTLLTDAGQFAFDINGMPSPEVIHVEYRTEGLSPAVVPSVKVQNILQQWTGNKINVSYLDIISANFLRVVAEIERFNLKREIVINKVNDAKAIIPIIEYAYGPSPTEPPKANWIYYDDYAVQYGELSLVYEEGWFPSRPELVPENRPYLWMRISVDNRATYSYSPLTGPKGEPGKDGMQNVYCGPKTMHPVLRPDGSPLIPGDYYLDIRDTTAPVPYIFQDNGIWRAVSSTDPEWSAIASVTREDVMALGTTLKTTSSYYAFFALLSANEAYLDNLGSQNIVVKNGGSIQSENYQPTEGIEGWKIDSDGSADFNNGTWRGSFANGLVFRSPSRIYIDKTQTQKEAYKLLKKAGIGAGVYNSTGRIKNKFQGGLYNSLAPAPVASCCDYAPFSCVDYDTDKVGCNIPIRLSKSIKTFHSTVGGVRKDVYVHETIFGYCAMIIPFTFHSWIMVMVKEADVNPDAPVQNDYELDGYYLLNQTALENIMNDRVTDLNPPEDPMNPSYRAMILAKWGKSTYERYSQEYFHSMRVSYGVFPIPGILTYAVYSLSETMNFGMFPIFTASKGIVMFQMESETSETDIGLIFADVNSEPKCLEDIDYGLTKFQNVGNGQSGLFPWLTFMPSFHVDGDQIAIMAYGRKGTRGVYTADITNDFHIEPHDRFLFFHETLLLDVDKLNVSPYVYAFYNDRIFGIFDKPNSAKSFTLVFAELNKDGSLRLIPNETVSWEFNNYNNEPFPNSSIANLFQKDGMIYGALCGTVFRYDIESDKIYDMSLDIASAVQIDLVDTFHLGSFAIRGGIVSQTIGSYIEQIIPGLTKTSAMTSNICWDNKEQSVMFNYKIRFMNRDTLDGRNENRKEDSDSWICVPVFFNPQTGKYKLFAMGTNLFDKMALPYGRFSCISDASRRVFVSDSCVIFINGIKLKNTTFMQENVPCSEYDRIPMKEPGLDFNNFTSFSPRVMSVLDDYLGTSCIPVLYNFATYGSEMAYASLARNLDEGVNSKAFLIRKDMLEIGSVFPFISRRVIIRETNDELRLIVPIIINSFTQEAYPGSPFDNSIFNSDLIMSTTSKPAWDGYIVGEAMTPFLVINKNSDELVGASFMWDFPAQLTTVEGIGGVMDTVAPSSNLIGSEYLRSGNIDIIKEIAESVCKRMISKK